MLLHKDSKNKHKYDEVPEESVPLENAVESDDEISVADALKEVEEAKSQAESVDDSTDASVDLQEDSSLKESQTDNEVIDASPEKSESKENIDLDGDVADQLDMLFKSNIKILTAEGGFLHRPKEQQEIMALYDNGIFLVSKSHMSDPYVLKLESYAKLRDITIKKKIPVSLEVIRDAYRHATANTASKDENSTVDLTEMQHSIVDLIQTAVDNNVSDIHVICSEVSAIVEMRKNGVLKQQLEWQANFGHDFCAACFAMADASDSNYNPTEYQAARISSTTIELPMEIQALRLQFNPLAYGGRYMIARLLYSSKSHDKSEGVSKLGYHQYQVDLLNKMSQKPVGICVVSGPTGSGKSTTLFQLLTKVMEDCHYERNVLTIEDPPERPIEGAKQMPVTNASTPEERDIKFIQAISAAMRSDPDTIMIGEVRDASSAGLAIEAAMTGHQVWTTVHANDALMILNRLRNIGVAEHNLYTPGIIFGLVAQRLTRKICPNCRIPYPEALKKGLVDEGLQGRLKATLKEEQINKMFIADEKGCKTCGEGHGFVGRTVCAEIIYPDDKFMHFMMQDNLIEAKRYWIKDLKGMTMLIHGLMKAVAGDIPPTEIERVVGAIEFEEPINLGDYE